MSDIDLLIYNTWYVGQLLDIYYLTVNNEWLGCSKGAVGRSG
ncbi:MAG: hypothetical protein ACFFCF_08150 [Promethearchaeota archaeon]